MAEGRVVKVAKIPKTEDITVRFSSANLLTELCYHYRFPFSYAQQIPHFRVCQLLRQARRQQAKHYYELTQIVAAPHSKGGELYNQLTQHYSEHANA